MLLVMLSMENRSMKHTVVDLLLLNRRSMRSQLSFCSAQDLH